ncbi:hypothetical protein THIOM_003252, partial [Candidatus Thiomargarita nelsonii]
LIATVTLLTACTHRPIPVATSYATTAQQKMQAAHHWNVLAYDVAKRLKKSVDLTFSNVVDKPPLVINITDEQEKKPFGKAFSNLLTTKLVQQGMIVLTGDTEYAGDNLVIDYDMQVIYHKDRRRTYWPPGLLTALTGGVFLVKQAIDNWQHPGLAAIPFVIAGDIKSARSYQYPGETNTEVLITTLVTKNQQYIFGDSRIYYINDGD